MGAPKKAAVPPELAGLELYEGDARLLKRWPELLRSWQRSYPGVDIAGEIAKAHAWEVEHPGKRKKDRAAYLGRWLRRCEEGARNQSVESNAELEAAFVRVRDSGVLDQVEREAQALEAARRAESAQEKATA